MRNKHKGMTNITKSDAELIESYLAGDVHSFEILLGRCQKPLYSYILAVVRDSQLAEDIFQDTFVKVIQTLKLKGYTDQGKFNQFVMRIAHNLIIDHYRGNKRLPVVDVQTDDYDMLSNTSDNEAGVEYSIMEDEVYSDLKKMVSLLPDELREVLYMRIYMDMSFKEIADVTNVSINTALGRMRYAILRLRKMISENQVTMEI